MSGQLLRKRPQRMRAGLALLVFSVLSLVLFASSLPPTTKATLDPQEPNTVKKPRSEFVPGEVLVRYRNESIAKQQTRSASNVSDEQILLTDAGRAIAVRVERFEGSDLVPGLRLARVAADDTMAAVEALRKQPNVLYAEPNYLLYADVTNPNDPRFLSNELYGLTKIGAPLAWDTTQGSSSVVVGVIDEGIDRVHQDLQANIWVNPGDSTVDGLDNDSNGFIDDVNGYNFITNSGNITADFHGTHVGGTVGAVGNNGIGVVGVNWNVRLMSLKFLGGAGGGGTADAIRACNYAKQMRDLWVSSGGTQGANVRVLNNSYGGGSFSQAFLDAISGLSQSSILFVASAGNVTAGASEPNNEIIPHYPSSYVASNVIGVANTDSNDNLSGSSHYGRNTIHLSAPGSGILSTTPGNNYGLLSGTSMATPHVSGAAALLLAHNPNLTLPQLKSLLIFNGDPAAALTNKTVTGRRLNVFNSFQALAENDTTPPGTVTGLQVNTQNGRSLNIGWTASGDDGAAGQASLYQLTFTDATTSDVIPLTSVLPVTSGAAQSVDIKLPYRHVAGTISVLEFDNVGNQGTPATLPVSVPAGLGDPYLISLGSPVALSTGGTPLSLIGDDKLRLNQSLPFAFPFFGESFTSVHVSTNGNLFFSTPPTRANGDADDVPGSVVGLTKFKMISGLWDDLRTDRSFGDDVFITADANHVIFRWKGVTFGDGSIASEFPVNFEIELFPDGTIKTRYGAGNTNVLPTVGIGGGEPEAYDVPSHTSEQTPINLTNAQEVTFSPRVKTLTIASSNPASGVNITVTPADNAGQGNGTTEFARAYDVGTVVNLTAPVTASGNNFLKWQRDGVDWATTAATSITIDANRTMTAVYATQRTLTVTSSNPASGVNITVTPTDNSSAGNGTTPFARTYNDGTTVNLTAPATAGGNNFLKWQRDGVDWATTAATSVTMGADHSMTAIYITPRTLTVASVNPASGVSITVSPADNASQGNGTTPFARTYNNGTDVTLTAPATASGNNFVKWQKDGADWATTLATTVTMDAARTMTAVYVTPGTLQVNSLNPNAGVAITVTPNDNLGNNNGTTPFSRTYNNGANVNLTAPLTASGNNFVKWTRNGSDYAVTPATSFTMGTGEIFTAVYETRTLTVASSNPSSGAAITVTPNDNNGFGNGMTGFTRTYNNGTVVNLTAALTAGGNNFVKWQKNGTDVTPFNPTTSVTMDGNHTMTAVYATPRTLTVSSSNPASGVSITVTPSDNASLGNGSTVFARTYNHGTTVNLTAPATASGNNFLKWQKDGADFAGNTTLATSVLMDAAHTMMAVYITPRTLTVASVNPASGVNISVSPADNASLGNGTTQFTRTYNDGATVNLTAPATAGGNNFLKWQKDGVDWATTLATSVMLDGDRTMTAVYITPRTLTVNSVNPASGVNITVSPADNGSLGNGTTPFTRTYNTGAVINLTAPATASGNNFVRWQKDGIDFATTLATSVTMDAAHTMTAVYAIPRELTITSSGSSSGVNITVTPSDINGLGNGVTPMTRTYHDGAIVGLTAPPNAGGNPFLKWQRDGVDWAVTQETSVTMDMAHTMTAVFVDSMQFSSAQFNVGEADGSVTVTVTRSGPTTAVASVDYTTSDDVATQKGDYIFSAGRLNFAVGEASKSFKVLIVDDVYQEGTETLKVMLSNPSGAPLGVRSVANVTIFDNDVTPPTTNPLDNADARFFVRQHYLDFLNREPDTSGLDFWRDQITSCGANQSCIEVRRINVSAAFFRSIEFQETGYLVERLYKVAYGDAMGTSTLNGTHQLAVPIVRYQEFLPDSQQISAGVVVGQTGWEVVLENNKRNFTAQFVERARFTTALPVGMSSMAYVDALNANAGGALSSAERNQLIADLTSGAKTRAEVLRQVAEDPDLKSAEDSRAFVLMQYFGYMRRNPNDAPELGLDYTGYDFWLTKLNQFNGNFISAEMVKAFISSDEYRHRFGP